MCSYQYSPKVQSMCIRSQTNLSRVDKIWRSGFNPKVPRLTLVYLPVQMWILWFWHLEMLNLDLPVKCMGPGFSSGCWMWQAPPSSPYSQKPDKQIKSNKPFRITLPYCRHESYPTSELVRMLWFIDLDQPIFTP